MPASARKLAANRANAKKSTGPKSVASKAKVSQNRTVHGLTGQFRVLGWESQDEYNHFLDELIKDQQPVGEAETEAVIKMAEHTWLCKRALRLQDGCFSMEPTPPENEAVGQQAIAVRADVLDKWIRYHAAQDRAYRRASQDFLQLRNQRIKEARGFESQKRAEAAEERKNELDAEKLAAAKARRQYEELRTAKAFADILPPDFAANGQMPQLPPGFEGVGHIYPTEPRR